MNKDYLEFLESKKKNVVVSGFDVKLKDLNKSMFDFQKFIVQRALKYGKHAIFANCGTGKTIMQLEWANHVSNHTNKPVLILAPLAVSNQTIKEGLKFNVKVKKYDGSDFPIQILNYEQLDNIDCGIYGGVVLDECFSPDTKVKIFDNGIFKEKYIKELQIGEKVLNCTGIDVIKKVKTKKINFAVKVGFNGREIITSGRHPYFTQRGWVAAKELQPSDFIMSTSKAMRVLHGKHYDEMENRYKEEVLRDIMLSEMENETARVFSESSQSRSSQKEGFKQVEMVQNSNGREGIAENKRFESNVRSFGESKGIGYTESNETQTFSAWGKWSRDDITSAINEGCSVREMDTGICHIFGEASKGLSEQLQSRFSSLRNENCDRSRWGISLQQKRIRQEKGRETGYYGLESFEVLEQTDNRLDKYRNARGELYFYDLEIERHPSFTVNDCLVHNSSILKNYEGETKKSIIEKFKKTPYKLACTATPSPNDPMELGNHSEFLDVMTRNEMLAMYFVHDGGETSKWRLKGHAVKDFYNFIGTWAVMLNKPADIGFDMVGYDLPKLNLIEKLIITEKRDNGSLFNETAISATNFNQELRLTKTERLNEVVKIVNQYPDENFIIWIKQNEEGEMLKKLLPDAIEVKGSDTNEWKEEHLLGFAENKFRILISKTKIASFGLNYQNCRNQIFASLDFSFEGLYQSIRRCYRFGQKKEVNIYLITTDTMSNVRKSIDAKQKQFELMQYEMSKQININLKKGGKMSISNFDTKEESNDWFTVKRGDCVQLISGVESNSVGLSVFSPPFADLYTYSNHIEDMGNSKDFDEFMVQFSFLIKELYRVMMSGRNVCIHCMDLPIQKGKHGFIGLRDFSGFILKAFEEVGFIYASRVTIWKDPVVEMQRTKALGLLHKQVKKDSTMSRVGIPDYVMIFRKDGDRDNPVTNTNLSVDLWQKYASPVWMDINYGNTLQGFRNGRESNDEKHICPLQLDTIERLIHLYSNEGDVVFTPFMGIGSEVYQAVKMGRKAVGFELKESYFDLAKANINMAMEEKQQGSIF